MRNKGLLEAMIGAATRLFDGAKTIVRVGSAHLNKFEVKIGVHQGILLRLLLISTVIDIITENTRRGVINEVL